MQSLLDQLSKDEDKYNDFIYLFQQVHTFNFNQVLKHNHLDPFEFSLYLLNQENQNVFKYLEAFNEDDKDTIDYLIKLFKTYYLYFYSKYEANSIELYYYVKNIYEALKLVCEFKNEATYCTLVDEMTAFAEYYFNLVSESIIFEKQNQTQFSLESFIANLTPEFKELFSNQRFISPLIYYLFGNKHIDKYGYWLVKNRRKTEILGLIYALADRFQIREIDSKVKILFRKTFHIELTQKYINSNDTTKLSESFRKFLAPEIGRISIEVVQNSGRLLSV